MVVRCFCGSVFLHALYVQDTYLENIISPDKHEVYMRVMFCLFMIGFAIYASWATRRVNNEMTVAKKIAMHDISTGLPNINMLEKELDKAISLVGYEQQLVCVAFEVNELEDINYLFGSDKADNVIKSLATNIEYSLDKGTFFSRISESEFFVFFPASHEKESLSKVGIVQEILESPIPLEDSEIYLDYTIGVAVYPKHGTDAESMIRNCNRARRAATHLGSEIFIFEPMISQSLAANFKIHKDLVKAIKNDDLLVYYQPKVTLDGNKVYGVEALLRWEHPEKGFISLEHIIHTAEQTELITDLTEYVIKKVLLQYKEWLDSKLLVNCAINVSAKSIYKAKRVLIDACDEHRVIHENIILELTESVLLKNRLKEKKRYWDIAR